MDCQRTAELLSPYMDGELAPDLGADLERHVEQCPACRGHLEELGRNRTLLAGLPRLQLPPELYGRVVQEIRSHRRGPAPTLRAPRHLPWWSGRALLAAAAAFVLLCLLGLTALGYYAEGKGPAIVARAAVNRHTLGSGMPVLGEPPIWTTASYRPGRAEERR